MSIEPSWELYRSFLRVVREGSLSRAARELGLTQPTVGRHVAELEASLGASLFTRSPGGLRATPLALSLVPFAETMSSAAAALRRAASGEALEERGSVRVTASEVVGVEVLPPALAAFREMHPQIDVEVVLSNRSADLLRREADVAVRMVRPTQATLIVRKLGAVRIAMHAHPRLVQKHGLPRSLDELRAHAIIGFDSSASVRAVPGLALPLTRDLFAFRCDSDLGQYAAIKAGFGIGFCQAPLAARDGLTPVLHDSVGFELGVWLVMHKDAKSSKRIRLMYEHLALYLKRRWLAAA